MPLEFRKYHICGNDIAVIDGRSQEPPASVPLYRQLADRHKGIGFDQAMLALAPETYESFVSRLSASAPEGSDLDKRLSSAGNGAAMPETAFIVVNADGSLAEQCGNGMCALAADLATKDGESDHVWRGPTRIIKTKVKADGEVEVEMGRPDFNVDAIPYTGLHDDCQGRLRIPSGVELNFYLVNMGNPHAIIFLGLDQQDLLDSLEPIGAALAHNEDFPAGVNLSLVMPRTADKALMRVFERGAGPTQCCGSASCAAIACAQRWFGIQSRLILEHPGGEVSVHWSGDERPIYLYARPVLVYEGRLAD